METRRNSWLLAKEIGHFSNESWSAVESILSYFGISTPNQPDQCDNPVFSIPIYVDAEKSCCHARFFPDSKKWRLIKVESSYAQFAGTDGPYENKLNTQQALKLRDDSQYTLEGSKPTDNLIANDWTILLPRSEHTEFLISRDWAATALGSIRQWPSALRLMTMKMLSDPRPANLYWYADHPTTFFILIKYQGPNTHCNIQ